MKDQRQQPPRMPRRWVSADNPCVVCGGTDRCSFFDDGLSVCGRRSGAVRGFKCQGPSHTPGFHCYYPDQVWRRMEEAHEAKFGKDRLMVLVDWDAPPSSYEPLIDLLLSLALKESQKGKREG